MNRADQAAADEKQQKRAQDVADGKAREQRTKGLGIDDEDFDDEFEVVRSERRRKAAQASNVTIAALGR